MTSLCDYALDILQTADPVQKAGKTRLYVQEWRDGHVQDIGHCDVPDRPARPQKPELKAPQDMPKRRQGGAIGNKIVLLHALAHIELNAIDLSWDIIARFAYYANDGPNEVFRLPKAFYDDWMKVADDEAKHFLMLESRLQDFGATYGDLPAHDGLWEASDRTAHDLPARLAVVPMVLEARGLDVTPNMIEAMMSQGDEDTASLLQIIHDDEITHVRAGTVWFEAWCNHHNLNIEDHWQQLVKTYFTGSLKPPFNHPSRRKAGMLQQWYEPLAENLQQNI